MDNVYDYRNRLVAVRNYGGGIAGDRTEYRYDPLGRPSKKITTAAAATTTTDLTYMGVSGAVTRETETGATNATRSYAFDILGWRTTMSDSGGRFSYVYDPLGSVELLLDQANGIKAAYGYLAYGEANPSLSKTAVGFTPATNLYRFTGKRFDPAAKAYDMGARHYFPARARWFQQDVYPDALDNLGLSTDPLTANRYQFTGANPINYIELDGHKLIHRGVGGGGVAAGRGAGGGGGLGGTGGGGRGQAAPASKPRSQAAPPDRPGPTVRGERHGNDHRSTKPQRGIHLAKGRMADQDHRRGPSGEPKRHTVDHPTRKRAKDAARNNPRSNTAPDHDTNTRSGRPPEFHSTRNSKRIKPTVHHRYPR